MVAADYDHTILTAKGILEPWDNYILDEDIVRLLRMLYKPFPNARFAAQDPARNPNLKYHFTAPYSAAAYSLGYAAFERSSSHRKQI